MPLKSGKSGRGKIMNCKNRPFGRFLVIDNSACRGRRIFWILTRWFWAFWWSGWLCRWRDSCPCRCTRNT